MTGKAYIANFLGGVTRIEPNTPQPICADDIGEAARQHDVASAVADPAQREQRLRAVRGLAAAD